MATADSPKTKDTLPQLMQFDRRKPFDQYEITATDLDERRELYKKLDKWLKRGKLELRYIPLECAVENLDGFAPTIENQTVWATMYSEAASLIRHDDTLNWQKFHYMVLFNAALITGFGVAIQFEIIFLLFVFPLIGILFSWLFDLTLQEGMRCVRAHREKIKALDSKALGGGKHFMFMDNPWNHRDALEAGPLLLCCFWLLMLVVPFYSCCSWLLTPSNAAQSVTTAPQQPVNPVIAKPAASTAPRQPVNPVIAKPAASTAPQQPVNPVTSKPAASTAPQQPVNPVTSKPAASTAPQQPVNPVTSKPAASTAPQLPAPPPPDAPEKKQINIC